MLALIRTKLGKNNGTTAPRKAKESPELDDEDDVGRACEDDYTYVRKAGRWEYG